MTDRELMQMALDALFTCQEDWIFDGKDERPTKTYDEKLVSAAFKVLRARLAQPEPEPVAWRVWNRMGGISFRQSKPDASEYVEFDALYPAPPQREWQGLTDEEIAEIELKDWFKAASFARAIEAKLKEKNNG